MKRLVFTLLYWLGVTRLVAWRTRRQVKILCYHSVTPARNVTEDPHKLHLPLRLFEAQLEHLRKNYCIISLREYVAARRAGQPVPENAVILTFDDGFRNFYTVAAPPLERLGWPATVFIITNKTPEQAGPEATGAWQPEDDLAHLSWAEARDLCRSGKLEIGSHTHTHQRLPELTEADAKKELAVSLEAIRARLGEQDPPLTFPHGQTSPAVRKLAEAVGYSCALSSELGGNGDDAHLYGLRRVVIAADDNVATFAARVAGLTWGWQSR